MQQSATRLAFAVAALLVTAPVSASGKFSGSASCSQCHTQQFQDWKGSHHDLAMQHAGKETVLGDFNDTEFARNGITSRFFRKNGKFFVNTDGKDGRLQDFEIKYTFGVTPLQQYLIEFPDGRLQALSIAWDSRPENAGGQRWFHLYPDEVIDHQDELHWTGAQQNWNYMCADCHSTNFSKGYKASDNSFNSTWSEIDVACEACHGPGGDHLAWTKLDIGLQANDITKGLNFLLGEHGDVSWPVNPVTGTAQRSTPNTQHTQMEVCASCHSRRGIIREGAVNQALFLDHYQPALLTENLYHADGQILDEVYVWGSFKQSKMFAAGVTCSDCHNPHSLELRAEGSAVCAQCHLPAKFAAAKHHHHQLGSTGASCLNCHMPETIYMVVDPRRDHSIRIPRPDQSLEFGTPNACNQCHQGESLQWATEKFSAWYPQAKQPFQNWTRAFTQARAGSPAAGQALANLILNPQTPDIARATAVFELSQYIDTQTLGALQAAISDRSPLVRMAAMRSLEAIPPASRLPFAGPLLQDDYRVVRIEAARALAGVQNDQINQAGGALMDKALREYVASQELNADRVEAQMNLGNLQVSLGDPIEAEQKFRKAIKLNPRFVPVYINLSDLYRSSGLNEQALKILHEGITQQPQAAVLHHSLGLAQVRQGNKVAALTALGKAVDLTPDAARYSYVYGVALNSAGQVEASISVLGKAHDLHPNNREILFALATINRDMGRTAQAMNWAEKLLALNPADPGTRQLLQSLGGRN